jgi:hypothetical protein
LAKAHYIVEPERIVAQDLAEAIGAVEPLVEVRVFEDAERLLAALTEARPTLVILQDGPADLAQTRLAQALAEYGIPYGVMRMSAASLAADVPVLTMPFSDESVAVFLKLISGAPASVLADTPEMDSGRDGPA